MRAGGKVGGQARGPQVRAGLRLDPGLLGRLVARDRPRRRTGRARRGASFRSADDRRSHRRARLRPAVEHVGDQRRRAEAGARDRRAEQLALAEFALDLAARRRGSGCRWRGASAGRSAPWRERSASCRHCRRPTRIWKPLRRAVAAVGAGDAAMVERAAPPRAGQRGQDVMMMLRRALPAVGGAEIMMLGRMGVAGEAHGEAPALEQREQRFAVGQIVRGVGGIEIGAQAECA